jgi:predicted TIM-barrel fold metal-dependent hydrolase
MLERVPRLKIFLAESGASWVPFTLFQCDHYFPVYSRFDGNILRMKPSEYARRQVFHGFYYDAISPTVIEHVGEDNIMWEADYVHSVSTFPNSRSAQEASLRDVPDERIRNKILAGNAVKLFKLEP